MNQRDLEKAIEAEVAFWPGVTVEFAKGGKHPKAKLWFEGKMLARPYSGTPSDGNSVHVTLADMRRTMKTLGAKRDKPEPSREEVEAPYRKPNDGAASRPNPAKGEQAKPKPTMAEQLGDKVIGHALHGGKKNEVVAVALLGQPVQISDQPAERLLKQLRDRGCTIESTGPVTRSWVVMTAATMVEDGIYFGLPMEVYRNVPRLGAGSLINLNKSAGDFWAGSWLDPDRKDEQDEEKKAWQVVGEAYHCARLEPDEFEKRFCRKASKSDWAEEGQKRGAVWNGIDVGNMLSELGATKKRAGESVADQAQRLEDEGWKGVIWPLEQARAEALYGDRIPLDAKVWDEIARDMERLKGSKDIAAKFTEAGASEVSVFWTDENNIQRKARFDRLEPDYWLDFKTFDNSRGKRLEQALADAIRYNRYYVTAASYREAYEAVRQLEIRGEATDVERHLVARIQISPKKPLMWFIFQQKSGVPNLLGREFVFFDAPDTIKHSWDTGADEEAVERGHAATERPTLLYAKGIAEIDYAKRLFALYSGVYRPGEPWAPLEPMGRISDLEFAPAWLEGRYE